MTPFYTDDWLTLYGGDCRAVLAELPADSVDCVVTSPPYWGLRDYGTAAWIGGDEACDHRQPGTHVGPKSTLRNDGRAHTGPYDGEKAVTEGLPFKEVCGKCGATRQDSQLGLERTPEEYVANMVAVFAGVRRVLKPSGTCWLNLGDSYAGGGTMGRNDQGRRVSDGEMREGWKSTPNMGSRPAAPGLKPKDLVGIPWRVAFALQADGWYLRSDIIWSKPNPMPESVTDRPTKSHEYLFLLTKSARYYFDADAVREPQTNASQEDVLARAGLNAKYQNGNQKANHLATQTFNPAGRNIRSVWTIATRPYPGAHFAVFPPELPERCIKAGSSERGVCPECGAPWERVVDVSRTFESGSGKAGNLPVGKNGANLQGGGETGDIRRGPVLHVETKGWKPACSHADEWNPVPATILDPFAGSGTVGMVANRLSRRAILIDLNPKYLVQQMKRNAQTPLGLTEGDAA